ncbi:MAG TPA: GNAT family N-acetyltransferase [Chloroflexota bacterium]|nr:GNAT family N-acetyltransferase [Chloroflexota bacterium]HUM68518.1 GNAT family N-acetyltransferase [Chloroflexota bacterium]
MKSEKELMSIKLVEPGEILPVIELHKSVFSPDFISRTIYASPKVEYYLSNLIKYPMLQREHFILGWFEDGDLKGYCHFRALSDSWHLNYVVILPGYQRLGIGKNLWVAGTEEGYQRGFRQVTLDVSQTNVQAMNWYKRQGLQIVEEHWIYEKQISKIIEPISEEKSKVSLGGWEAAEAWQSLYGFSKFHLNYAQRAWFVGRLGTYFRIFETIPSIIESTLALIDADRKLLFILSTPSQETDFEFIECSYRMQGEIV